MGSIAMVQNKPTLPMEKARTVVQLPDVRDRFIALGLEPLGTQPGEFGEHLRREIAQWSKLVRQFNLQPC